MYFDMRLWRFTEGVRLRIAAAVTVGLLAAAVGVARLALLGWLLALVFQARPFTDMVAPFALVAGVMVLRGVLEHARNMMAHRTATLVQLHIRERLYERIVALGPAHFGLVRTGEVTLAMIEGVEQLETYFGQYLPQLVVAALTPIGIFAFVLFLDLPTASMLLAFALLTLVAPAAFHTFDSRNSRRRARAYADFGAEFLDSVQGLATLKAFGQSSERGRILARKAEAVFDTTMWVLATNSLARGITDTGIAVGAAATLALGAYRVVDGAMGLEALLVILMMGTEVFRPLRDLRTLLHQGMNGQSAAVQVLGILAAEPRVRERAGVSPRVRERVGVSKGAALSPEVAFEGLSFTYPEGREPVLDGVDFKVPAGARIGVVGPSGSGKSTIVRLLLRLYDPDAGSVSIGGRDVRDLTLDDVRAQFAVVSQDTYLFHGTVEDNLRLGKPDASQEELEAAARAANAHDFVARLPEGYRTVIGERGIKLSGGQRQRIAIARALLRAAPILVLDEALSAVDAENEAVIQEALDRLMRGRTTLVFAHRLSSVIDCDRILVLDRGRLVESGSHAELMARPGVYHRLMEAQAREGRWSPGTAVAASDVRAIADALPEGDVVADNEPTDAILRAEGLGWAGATAELLRFVVSWKGRLTFTFLFGVARVAAFIGVGAVSALIVAAVKNGEPFDGLLTLLAVLAPLAGILHWLESWLAHDMAFRLLSEMRVRLFEKLDRLAPAYLVRRRTGDLVAMATHDVETVEYFFAHTIAPAFVAVLVPAVVLAMLLAYGWSMALALVPFLALAVLTPFVMRDRIDDLGSRTREALGELNAHAVDTVQGLGEVIAFQEAQRRGRAFVDMIRAHHRVRLRFFSDLTLQMSVLEVGTGLGGLAVIIAGSRLVQGGALDVGALPLLTLLAMAAFLPVSEIANVGRQLADTLGATRRIAAVNGEEPEVTDGHGVESVDKRGGAALEVDGVDFAYLGRRELALSGVRFTIPASRTVALVGPSGAGKTTLAHLLMRFWDPLGGTIRLDGHDLRDFRLDDLRRRIALVAQDTYLFNDTLRANILIARPSASVDDVGDAVERAALGEFVASLPDGLDTRVGERGMRLSGGQRQRVAIARAFLKDAPVLILDEATSHLDAASEAAVHRALTDLMHDRTTVIIAHRLSTIRDADQIVVLEEGRVIETGTHDALLGRGGLYAHLVRRQLGAVAAPAAE